MIQASNKVFTHNLASKLQTPKLKTQLSLKIPYSDTTPKSKAHLLKTSSIKFDKFISKPKHNRLPLFKNHYFLPLNQQVTVNEDGPHRLFPSKPLTNRKYLKKS